MDARGEEGAALLASIPGVLDVPLLTATKHSLRAALYTEALECLNALTKISKTNRKTAREKKGIEIIQAAAIQQHGSTTAELLAEKVITTLMSDANEDVTTGGGSRPGSRSAATKRRSSTHGSPTNSIQGGTIGNEGSSRMMMNNVNDTAPDINGDNNDWINMNNGNSVEKLVTPQPSVTEIHPGTAVTHGLEQRAASMSYLPLDEFNNNINVNNINVNNITNINLQTNEAHEQHQQQPLQVNFQHNMPMVEYAPSSVPTSARTIGSLRDRLHGHELMVFEWMEADLYRHERETGKIPSVQKKINRFGNENPNSDEEEDEEEIDPLFWTAEEKAQKRKERHDLKHALKNNPDNHPWFMEFDEKEGMVLMGLEKELRLQREKTKITKNNGVIIKTEKEMIQEAMRNALRDNGAPPSRPGTANTNSSSVLTKSTHDSNNSSYLSQEEEEIRFTPGQIIGKSTTGNYHKKYFIRDLVSLTHAAFKV